MQWPQVSAGQFPPLRLGRPWTLRILQGISTSSPRPPTAPHVRRDPGPQPRAGKAQPDQEGVAHLPPPPSRFQGLQDSAAARPSVALAKGRGQAKRRTPSPQVGGSCAQKPTMLCFIRRVEKAN